MYSKQLNHCHIPWIFCFVIFLRQFNLCYIAWLFCIGLIWRQFSDCHIFFLLCSFIFLDSLILGMSFVYIVLLWQLPHCHMSICFTLLYFDTIQSLLYPLVISYCCTFGLVNLLSYLLVVPYCYVSETIQSLSRPYFIWYCWAFEAT